ncbi:butyrophilin subfamily 3 member A2-like [Mauremys mutica]|uniref:Ig-like domain-containing protein n=1 Tax=Mauremys mutica TaxID=74926 RepID=A0A9D3XTK8_9SAUR|nr:butyrophilin subfamily 3 member A2-like [Mauremys mutica]KAH1185827.1 hypothetical protein KIL84_018576 [Mauremys mutica]
MAAQMKKWLLLVCGVVLLRAGDPVRIEADEGEDVLLPCIVERRDADRLPDPTVNWQRSGSEVVNSYYNGKNHPVYQSGRYKGRTEFASQGLSEGNASLLLKNVTPADFGNYTCHASLYENSPQTLQTVLLMQKETQGANVPGGRENRLRILSICVPLSIVVILVGGSVGYCCCKKKTTKSKAGDAEAAPEMEEFTRPRNSENTSVIPLH